MTRLITNAVLLLLILFINIHCGHHNDGPAGTAAIGKLVDFTGCSHYVVQLLSPTINDNVMTSWTDTATGKSYDNVFTVRDFILFQQANLQVGDTFSFTMDGAVPPMGTYMTCMIQPFSMPSLSHNVTNIKYLSGPLTGELVDAPTCSFFVVRLLQGPLPDSSLVASWTDSSTHTTYSNVFTVRNGIEFSLYKLSVGDTFTFTTHPPDAVYDPYQTCGTFPYAMPSASNNVTHITFLSGPH